MCFLGLMFQCFLHSLHGEGLPFQVRFAKGFFRIEFRQVPEAEQQAAIVGSEPTAKQEGAKLATGLKGRRALYGCSRSRSMPCRGITC